MKKGSNTGFTLVELLAVIVILAIVLAIAVPGISGIIKSTRTEAFEKNAKLIIKGINTHRNIDSGFNVSNLSADNIAEELEIDNANYQSLNASVTNDEVYIDIIGKNQWDGLEIYGAVNDLTIIEAGTYTLAPESCFTFDSSTKTITKYDLSNSSCPKNPEIPNTIGGVAVEHIGPGSFITPTAQWCNGDQVSIDYIRTEADDYCYFDVNWDNPGPITAVKLPKDLKTIGYGAFLYNQLANLIIQNNVTTIDDDVFESNQLTSVHIPNSVTTIGYWAFSFNNLASLTIPNSVITMNDWSFTWNLLTRAFIPSSVTTIGKGSFRGNQNLSTLIVDSNNPNYKSVNNAIYSKDGTTLVVGTKGMSNNIESTVTKIGNSAFYQMGITSVTIPSSVTLIDGRAFFGNQLTNVAIPYGVTTIGTSAFSYNQLTSVEISSSVTTIGYGSFSSNKLAGITIPSSVTTIDSYALYTNQLTSITMERAGITINSNLLTSNDDFKTSYASSGAGTYTGTQTGPWTKQ